MPQIAMRGRAEPEIPRKSFRNEHEVASTFFKVVCPGVWLVLHGGPCREQHLALAPVSEDANFPETRPTPWSLPGSNSCRKPACCRLPGLPGGSIGPASVARQRYPEPDHAVPRPRQLNGSCGIAWPETRAHLAVEARCCHAEICPAPDRRSMRSCAGSTV